MSFCHRFLDSNRVSCIHKVNLDIDQNDEDDASYVTSWIDALVKRKIQHLAVRYYSKPAICEIPPSSLICKTLVYLKLCMVAFERLVSSCPVLEELTVSGSLNDGCSIFRVISRSLKKLTINSFWLDVGAQIVIDAPLLGFLNIKDRLTESFIVENMHPNASRESQGSGVLSKRSMIRDFLPGISGIKEMIISWDAFKIICLYSKLEPVPQFRRMSLLNAIIHVTDMKWLPTFLESCPNLKSLILEWVGDYQRMCSDEMDQISFTSVPECLSSSLEFVHIKSGVSGYVAEIELVRYFLESSAILRELTLRLNSDATQDVIFKSLLKIPKLESERENM